MVHRISRPFARTAAASLLAAALLTVSAAPALAHDELVGSEMTSSSSGTPEAVVLTFNNSIVEVGTEFIVRAADGSDVTDGLAIVNGPDVTQPLVSNLAPGTYSGAWRVVSSDGHPIEGAFSVVVAEDGSAVLGDALPVEGTAGDTAADDTTSSGAPAADGLPTTAIIGISIGGVAVVAGGAAALIVGNKRRAQGMAADARTQQDSDRSGDRS